MLNTIGRKLGFGFGLVLLLMVASVTVAYIKVDELVNKAIPVDATCNVLTAELGRSLIALRGFINRGGQQFKTDRTVAWTHVDEAVETLNELRTAMSRADQSTFQRVSNSLTTLRKAQDEVERLTESSADATKPDIGEKPLAQQMHEALTAIIEKK